MKLFMAIAVVVQLSFIVGALWLTGSVITSGIKAFTDSCGKTYGVESVVSGDWFCPDEK